MNKIMLRSLVSDFFFRFSSSIGFAVLMIYVYQRATHVVDLGIMSIAMTMPAAVFTVFSGKIFYRFGAAVTYRMAMLVRSVVFICAAVLADGILALTIVAACSSFLFQISGTAKMTYDAAMLPPEARTRFNAKKALFNSLSTVIGPAIGGVIAVELPAFYGLMLVALVGICAALALLEIPEKREESLGKSGEEAEASSPRLADMWRSIGTLRQRQPETLILVVSYIVIVVVLVMETPLVFPFVQELLQRDGETVAYLFSMCGFGGGMGALYLHMRAKSISAKSVTTLLALDGLCLLATTCIAIIEVTFVLFILLGVIGTVAIITVETEIQSNVASDIQPVLFALVTFAGGVGGASLTLGATAMADYVGAVLVLRVCALAEVVIGIIATMMIKRYLARRQQ